MGSLRVGATENGRPPATSIEATCLRSALAPIPQTSPPHPRFTVKPPHWLQPFPVNFQSASNLALHCLQAGNTETVVVKLSDMFHGFP